MTEQQIRDDERDLIVRNLHLQDETSLAQMYAGNMHRPKSITITLTKVEADRVYSALLEKTCPEGYDCGGPSPRKCPDCSTIAKIDEARNES